MAGAPTTAGSPALLGARPPDAFIVSRLRAAGAIILAKANMSEWANFRSTRSTSGWSTLGGQTANPYALDRNPSGSSSGSAARPVGGLRAARRGHGDRRVDRLPVKRLRRGRHQADPRAGQPGRHRAAVPGAGHRGPDGHLGRGRGGAAVRARRRGPGRQRGRSSRLRRLRGMSSTRRRWRARGSASGGRPRRARTPATEALLDGAVDCLRALGATVVDPVDLPDIDKVTEPEFDALNYEFKHGINAYLKYLAAYAGDSDLELPGTLAELIEYNERNAATGPRPVRPGDLPGGAGDQRRPGRPGLPGVARRGAHPGADGGGDAARLSTTWTRSSR